MIEWFMRRARGGSRVWVVWVCGAGAGAFVPELHVGGQARQETAGARLMPLRSLSATITTSPTASFGWVPWRRRTRGQVDGCFLCSGGVRVFPANSPLCLSLSPSFSRFVPYFVARGSRHCVFLPYRGRIACLIEQSLSGAPTLQLQINAHNPRRQRLQGRSPPSVQETRLPYTQAYSQPRAPPGKLNHASELSCCWP